jgi:hypothetical protein
LITNRRTSLRCRRAWLRCSARSVAPKVWYVDDGSTHDSLALLRDIRDIAAREPRVGVIELRRGAARPTQ